MSSTSVRTSLPLTESGLAVLEKRYLKRDEEGNILESPEEMFWRVSRNMALMDVLYCGKEVSDPGEGRLEFSDWDWATLKASHDRLWEEGKAPCSWDDLVARVEERGSALYETAKTFYKVMTEGQFLPNTPALINAGRELQQLSACFVLPVHDSMISIFDSLKHAALIHQSGGGTGFSFSNLRPKNDVVRSTGGVASGPVSFMKVFNAATEAVKQGGVRRGANMGILRVDHPDILEFITCKTDTNELTNFNISVGITEQFMEAVGADEEYRLTNPRNGQIVGELGARKTFEKIVDQAWRNGEPGIVFLDRLNRDNPTPDIGEIESTNPCGEQPLLPYEACCLGSVNLGAFTKPVWEREEQEDLDPEHLVDWEALAFAVRTGVHFLDNLIDANKYPLPEIARMSLGNRKIGLGVMGWADMLLDLGIPYNSQQAVDLASRVMGFVEKHATGASEHLASIRGVFPNYERSVYPGKGIKVRNATATTIAPTGTISMIAGASSGIEPIFSIAFTRNVLDNKRLVEVNPRFEKVAKALGFYTPELMEKIAVSGTVRDIPEVPERVRKVFVTAHEISPESHIKMQAAFQRFTHNAVSKTVNFSHDATREDVRDVFLEAYKLGCKGVTVYRDGSRQEQVLTVGTQTAETAKETGDEPINGIWGRIRPIERPPTLEGFTTAKETPVGKLFLTMNTFKGHPVELFAQIGKAGSDVAAFTEAVARMISIALRSGIDPQEIADQLVGIGGSRSIGFGPNRIRSVPDAIGQFVDEYVNRVSEEQGGTAGASSPRQDELPLLPGKRFSLCPSCGTWNLVHIEGCLKCLACDYSEC